LYKQPSYCIEGETKKTHCKDCNNLAKEKNIKIIDIKSPKCIICNKKQPSYCKEGETKATHCKDCSLEVEEKENIEMVNIVDGKQCKT
jgi:hypothetical protein